MSESVKTILSIDPGAASPSGWAVLTIEPSPKLIAVGQGHLLKETTTSIYTRIREALAEKVSPLPTRAVIESAYLNLNVRTAIMLGRAYGRWQEVCEANGMEVVEAQASQWQTAELTRRGRGRTTKRAARKAMSIAKAAGIWGGASWTEHQADAALMGRWYAIRSCYGRGV
jgi:Holliday junction resolvasome RuvABC endonuclease subunit